MWGAVNTLRDLSASLPMVSLPYLIDREVKPASLLGICCLLHGIAYKEILGKAIALARGKAFVQ